MSFKNPRLRFGKYDGEPIRDVPTDYLRWLDGLPDLRPWTRRQVRAELKTREAQDAAEVKRLRRLAGATRVVPVGEASSGLAERDASGERG